MCDIARMLRNWYSRPIAIIAVIVLGVQALRGVISWQTVLIVITGIIIMFMAHNIVALILGESNVQKICAPKCAAHTPTCPGGGWIKRKTYFDYEQNSKFYSN